MMCLYIYKMHQDGHKVMMFMEDAYKLMMLKDDAYKLMMLKEADH